MEEMVAGKMRMRVSRRRFAFDGNVHQVFAFLLHRRRLSVDSLGNWGFLFVAKKKTIFCF